MIYLIFLPILVQAVAMFFDEFYYHRKRGLPRWERIGHPIDTASVLLCMGMTALLQFSVEHLAVYLGVTLFSSLLITKDEFVHAEHCDAGEAWLHSLLFVLHPIVFLAIGYAWFLGSTPVASWPEVFHNSIGIGSIQLQLFLKGQVGIIFSFFIYQIVYWSYYVERSPNK